MLLFLVLNLLTRFVLGRSIDFVPRLGRRSFDNPPASSDNRKLFEELEESKRYSPKRIPMYYTIPRLGKRLSS